MELIQRVKEEELKNGFSKHIFKFEGLEFFSFENGSKVELDWIANAISNIKEQVIKMARRGQKIIQYRTSTGDCILVFSAERNLKNRELYHTHFMIATSSGYVEVNREFTLYDEKTGNLYTFEPV